MEKKFLFNGFDEDCSENEVLDFTFHEVTQLGQPKRIQKIKNDEISSPKRLMKRISRGLHVGKVKKNYEKY